MRLSRRIAAAALASVLACDQSTAPGRGAGLSLEIVGNTGAALDSGRVLVRGPTNKTVTVVPGTTVPIDGLAPGTYTVALQGFDSGGVARFFQATGVTVQANQMATVTASVAEFASFVPTMTALPPSGMGTTFTVTYNSIAGAASYEVEAATNQVFTANRVTVSTTQTSAQVTVGSAGTYYVRVRAIDMFQGRGRASPYQTIQIIAAPRIVLSESSANFGAPQGGGNPAALTVAVTNGGGATLNGLSASVSYTSGSGWLSASLSTTTAPSTLTLQPTTGSLVAGTYTATVSVTSAVASNSPQTVTVTFTVGGQLPTIVLTPTSRSFNATQGGASPAPLTVGITNGGGGTLTGLSATVSYTTGSGWLSATLNTTTAPSTLTLQPTTGALGAGTYTATVSVASAVASNSPRTVTVTFTVAAQPTIVVTPASRSFSALQGGANPAAQTVAVANGGGGTLTNLSVGVSYSGSGGGWLSATLNTTTAPSTLTLQPATGGLGAGTYNATVSVASSVASNSPQTVSVTFTVGAPPPLIVLTPTSRSFSAIVGAPNPPAQTVAVTNGGGGSLSGLNESVTYTAGQPNGWLDSEINPKTAPGTLTLTAKTGSLPVGTYTATVSVTSGAASNSPQTVTVTFTVTPVPPRIVLTPTNITFSATVPGANPAAKTVVVTNGVAGTLSGLSATVSYTPAGSGWLTASLNSTTAPSTLTLTVNKAGLAAGTYGATVSVAAAGASNSPQTVSVTFTLTP